MNIIIRLDEKDIKAFLIDGLRGAGYEIKEENIKLYLNINGEDEKICCDIENASFVIPSHNSSFQNTNAFAEYSKLINPSQYNGPVVPLDMSTHKL